MSPNTEDLPSVSAQVARSSEIPEISAVNIEAVGPQINGGEFPVKRIVGDLFEVEADIFTHGHEVVRAVLCHREAGRKGWDEAEMTPLENDRWIGRFRLEENTTYEYTIQAWRDPFLSWTSDLRKRHAAGQDLTSELLEGKQLVVKAQAAAEPADSERLTELLASFDDQIAPAEAPEQALELLEELEQRTRNGRPADEITVRLRELLRGLAGRPRAVSAAEDPVADVILGQELEQIMGRYPDRSDQGSYHRILAVIADRPAAQFAAWYEMWPRSQGTTEGQSATFADMEQRLPEIKQMGFSVIYLPPIHPIGRTNRKGPNNSLACPPGSPGCPYAIGNELGGHTAIEPDLGTLADFERFVRACRDRGLEVALDLALQTSPDHPWVVEHPEWFRRRPDGSIKFAENPPKKYEDIYPLDFNTTDREGLWRAVLDVIRFWIGEGVRIFRVDNPHTKPMRFWEWLLAEVRHDAPDVIFLAEAFTRPKMMKALAKAGFAQSYTYFTWRNFKQEIEAYFTELTGTDVADYMRGNLFTNTPDILPEVLQNAPRAAFKMRAALAATLSSVWGMYNGFELCEGTPLSGREEYIDSEKYQYKVWDWDRPGNIKDFIARLNQIRKDQPALQLYRNLRFHEVQNDNLLFYSKSTPDRRNIILVVVNLDPYRPMEAEVVVPLEELGLRPDETYQVHELVTDRRFYWQGPRNFVRLDPEDQPAHIFQLLRWSHREQDFDYFI